MKKSLFPMIVSLAVALGAFNACGAPKPSAEHPIKVACVGDSITFGMGAPKGKSYPSQLQALLGDQWKVGNFGVSARTLLKKGDHPYWIEKAFKDAQAFQPNIVVIMLGTNDTKSLNWPHHDEFYADYKALVQTFQNLASKPRVYICRPVPVPAPGNYGINEANLDVEIPIIDQVAKDTHAGMIDLHAALEKSPQLFPDHIHPNAQGAALMAQTIANVLTEKSAPAMPAGTP
jgi:lysophospholipase L1-like esterase